MGLDDQSSSRIGEYVFGNEDLYTILENIQNQGNRLKSTIQNNLLMYFVVRLRSLIYEEGLSLLDAVHAFLKESQGSLHGDFSQTSMWQDITTSWTGESLHENNHISADNQKKFARNLIIYLACFKD